MYSEDAFQGGATIFDGIKTFEKEASNPMMRHGLPDNEVLIAAVEEL